MTQRNATLLGFLVFAIWASSMVWDALSASYDPPAGIQAAFLLVVGWVVGSRFAGKENGHG